jgi:hypothetical protein
MLYNNFRLYLGVIIIVDITKPDGKYVSANVYQAKNASKMEKKKSYSIQPRTP